MLLDQDNIGDPIHFHIQSLLTLHASSQCCLAKIKMQTVGTIGTRWACAGIILWCPAYRWRWLQYCRILRSTLEHFEVLVNTLKCLSMVQIKSKKLQMAAWSVCPLKGLILMLYIYKQGCRGMFVTNKSS